MYFINWFYSLASPYSSFIIVLSSSLPNSFSTFILLHCRSSAKPCRKQSREIIPKLCCTLESPEDFWKPLMPGSHPQTDWTGMGCNLGTKRFYSSPGASDVRHNSGGLDKYRLHHSVSPFSDNLILLNHNHSIPTTYSQFSNSHSLSRPSKIPSTFKVQVQTLHAPQSIPWLPHFTLISLFWCIEALQTNEPPVPLEDMVSLTAFPWLEEFEIARP